MKLFLVPLAAAGLFLAACAQQNVLGANEGFCDKNPEQCASVRQAHKDSDGNRGPVPSDRALQTGEVMRIWVAPSRDQRGVLRNSGHIYVN